MMADNTAHANEIAALAVDEMKALGFRKRGRTYNRRLDNGLIHVAQLTLQPSWGINSGAASYMFGVVVPRMEPDRDFDGFISESRAQLRLTQGLLAGTTFPADYEISSPRAAQLLKRELFEIGLPWLDRVPDEASVLAAWEKDGQGAFEFGVSVFQIVNLYAARRDAEHTVDLVRQIATTQPVPGPWRDRLLVALRGVGRGDEPIEWLPDLDSNQEPID